MRSSSSAKYYGVILAIFSLTLASAQNYNQYICVDAGDTSAAPVCNTTALQNLLPARVCVLSFFNQPDWSLYCSQNFYDAWASSCPKQNFNVEGFCGGTSGSLNGYSCLLKACNTDADCPQFQEVVPSPSQLYCYDCCQTCQDDDFCATQVSNGVYAAPGITSCISCTTSTPTPVVSTPLSTPLSTTPVTSQSHSRIRFANAQMSDFSRLGLAVSPFGSVPGLEAFRNTTSDWPVSGYFSLPLQGIQLNQATAVYVNDLITDTALTVPRNVTLVDNQSYTFIAVGPSEFLDFSNETNNNTQVPYVLFGVAEKPSNPALYAGQALVKVVNAVASSYGSRISLAISEGITIVYTQVSFGASTFFLPFNQQVDINAYLDGQTLLIRNLMVTPNATTVVYLRGDLGVGYRWSSTVVPFNAIAPPVQPPISEPSICVNGFVESTGYCNCYSGFTNDGADLRYKCSIQPPYYCQPLSGALPMENYVVPSIYDLHVSRNNLGLRVISSFIAARRTLIEFPNPECNLINSPEFFEKTIQGCNDEFIVNVPFASCGFTKTSEEDVDIYRGEMHVKHIDRIVVDDNTIERVVDTPFNIVIRLIKNLAVASGVEIVASPVFNVPVKAAFVGQKVDVATQTGQLEFVTSLPAPLIVLNAQLVDAPSVNATVLLANSNCSETGYCLQRLVVNLDIQNCTISGVYRIVVAIGCTTQQNCPSELLNSPASVTLTATIVAQSTCGEASIDIGLHGQLQAYNDPAFSSQASSFDNGKTAYFLISTYSDQVDLSNVDLVAVWYTGPNVPGQYLLVNDNLTNVGATNNFNYGLRSSSEAWFSFDVTVSSPDSTEETVFKLNNDEVGSYIFVAQIDVEWNPNDATPSNASPLKKRVTLEGTLSRQGSQLSSKVQIAGPKNTNEDAVSVSSVVSGSVFALFVALISVALI